MYAYAGFISTYTKIDKLKKIILGYIMIVKIKNNDYLVHKAIKHGIFLSWLYFYFREDRCTTVAFISTSEFPVTDH